MRKEQTDHRTVSAAHDAAAPLDEPSSRPLPATAPRDTKAKKTRVLVLGGGFGGLYALLHLDKVFAGDRDVEVTLVSRVNYNLFTPMLHEVLAGELDLSDIINPVRKMLRHTHFIEAEVKSIDTAAHRVTVSYALQSGEEELSYDHLLLAMGSETNYFDLPGVAGRVFTMKTGEDPFLLRNHIVGLLEYANQAQSESVRRSLLTFVVAGGGFAGVETIGGLNDFVRDAVTYYPELHADWIRVVLVHPGDVILPELGEELGHYAEKKLRARNVEVRTGTKVMAYTKNDVKLSDGDAIRTGTLVWTAGVKPSSALADLPFEKEHGRVVVDAYFEVPGFPGVWAVGDCAWFVDPKTGKPHPPTAQHAVRQGAHAGKNIVAAIRGEAKRPFTFSTIGQLAAIGRRSGVARIFGVKFSGIVAWFLWRTVYLMKLPRFEKKVRVGLAWALDFFFPRDLAQYITARDIETLHDHLVQFRENPILPYDEEGTVEGRGDATPADECR